MPSPQSFIFDSYAFHPNEGRIELNYAFDDALKFQEVILLPADMPLLGREIDELLFMLHLIGGASYFKAFLPKKMEIRSGTLNEEHARFWTTVYEKGLGEFFFKNKIDPHGVINFPIDQSPTANRRSSTVNCQQSTVNRILVPFGGGKDSIVTMELLRAAGQDITLLRVGAHPIITALAQAADVPLLCIERRLDPKLFALNAQGALNGHVPITAYISILSLVLAELYGFHAVAFSNESSASEGNLTLSDFEINHQWSKSLEFEHALQEYLRTSTDCSTEFFSLLRPWSELKIVQKFCSYPQYFALFTSCNENWKILSAHHQNKKKRGNPSPEQGERVERWCGECPKCAFAFALFAAFLDTKTLLYIFGSNLFDHEGLLPVFRELLGLEGHKPFECVGTPDEMRAAFFLASKNPDLANTKAMTMFQTVMLPTMQSPAETTASLLSTNGDHALPEAFQSLVL